MHMIKSSIKDYLFFGVGLVNLILISFALFLGSNALVEQKEASIVYCIFVGRIATVLGFTIFLSFYFKKIFENKEIDIFLSKSISRFKILLSFLIAAIILVIPFLIIASAALMFNGVPLLRIALWMLSFFVEILAMISISIFFNLLISSKINATLFILMFYLIARTIGSFIPYIDIYFTLNLQQVLSSLLKIFSIFIPRFDLLCQSSIVSNLNVIDYHSLLLGILQSLIFSVATVVFAFFDFRKKDF